MGRSAARQGRCLTAALAGRRTGTRPRCTQTASQVWAGPPRMGRHTAQGAPGTRLKGCAGCPAWPARRGAGPAARLAHLSADVGAERDGGHLVQLVLDLLREVDQLKVAAAPEGQGAGGLESVCACVCVVVAGGGGVRKATWTAGMGARRACTASARVLPGRRRQAHTPVPARPAHRPHSPK